MENKVWNRDSIIEAILKGDKVSDFFIERAVIGLVARQTADEREFKTTGHNNGVGLGKFDAEFYTKAAEFIGRSKNPNGSRLTPGYLAAFRKLNKNNVPAIGRYWRQILDMIEIAQAAKAQKQAA